MSRWTNTTQSSTKKSDRVPIIFDHDQKTTKGIPKLFFVPTERDGSGAGLAGFNFLGKGWAKMKGFKSGWGGIYFDYPSLYEIFYGIMEEAAFEVRYTSGIPEGSKLLQEAIDNIIGTW